MHRMFILLTLLVPFLAMAEDAPIPAEVVSGGQSITEAAQSKSSTDQSNDTAKPADEETLRKMCVKRHLVSLLPGNYADLQINLDDIRSSKWTYSSLDSLQGVKWYRFTAHGVEGKAFTGLIRVMDFQRKLSEDKREVLGFTCRQAISLTYDDAYFLLYDIKGHLVDRKASKIIMPMDE
jgi:hypothetical protein